MSSSVNRETILPQTTFHPKISHAGRVLIFTLKEKGPKKLSEFLC